MACSGMPSFVHSVVRIANAIESCPSGVPHLGHGPRGGRRGHREVRQLPGGGEHPAHHCLQHGEGVFVTPAAPRGAAVRRCSGVSRGLGRGKRRTNASNTQLLWPRERPVCVVPLRESLSLSAVGSCRSNLVLRANHEVGRCV